MSCATLANRNRDLSKAVNQSASISLGLLLICCFCSAATSQEIPLINPGGEAYPINPTGNLDTDINPGGVSPIETTGWDASAPSVLNGRSVQALDRGDAHAGAIRLAFGSSVAHVAANPLETPETAILFQETSHVVTANQEFILNFFGRGFFQFENNFDDLVSFFGYRDGSGSIVQVDAKPQSSIVFGTWTQAGHSYIVPGGSPLIGENLVVGFYTSSLNGGGYSSVDDISLSLGAGNPPGDADGDGDVDSDDVRVIANNFLNSVTVSTMGDLDDNGVVDFADFRIWKDATGFAGSMADAMAIAVPEPSAALLAFSASLAMLRTRRRRN